MEIIIRNRNIEKETYKIVTWAANTTGNQITDEICELAAFSDYGANSFFSGYIMPYCNVKKKYFKQHGLKEVNGRKIRILMDYHSHKVLNTKTEIYGLSDFLIWLKQIKGDSSGIILVCYEHNYYISEILLQSLRRCRLSAQFFEIVKNFVNCYNICSDKYGNEVKHCTLENITNIFFKNNVDFKRALSRVRGCYKVITYIKDNEDNFEEIIKLYVEAISEKQQPKQESQVLIVKNKKKLIHGEKSETNIINKIIEPTEIGINELDACNENPGDILSINYLKCKVIGWAINTTGCRYNDEIFHIAVFSPNTMFSQYIIPKKRIYLYRYRRNIRIIKTNNTRQLKDLQTEKILETKPEAAVLKDFIDCLARIKGEDAEGIVILYHENKKYSLSILLETLKRCKLTDSFCKVVKGFVNTYSVSQDKCKDITKSFTLNKLSEVLLNKQIEVNNALLRAKTCYEITEDLAQARAKEFEEKNVDMLNLIQPFITTLPNEEEELRQLKIINKQKQTKSMKKQSSPKPAKNTDATENIK